HGFFVVDDEQLAKGHHVFRGIAAAAAARSTSTTGSRTEKRAPPPDRFEAAIVPPKDLTTAWQIARPSPVPSPGCLVVKKGSKSRGRSAAAIPGPSSSTSSRISPASGAARTWIVPLPPIASAALTRR